MDKMTTNDAQLCLQKANEFFGEISKAMEGTFASPTAMVYKGLDRCYDLLTQDEENLGFMVCNAPQNGLIGTDLMMNVTLEEWLQIMADPMVFTGNDVSFFDEAASRRTFLYTLAQQVSTNIPRDFEAAKRHLLMSIAAVFNGANFYRTEFELIWVDPTSFDPENDEEIVMSKDISSYLVV